MSQRHSGLWNDVSPTAHTVNAATNNDLWSIHTEQQVISKAAKGEPYDYFLTVQGEHIPMIGDHGHGYPVGGPQAIQAGLRKKAEGKHLQDIRRVGFSNKHHVHVNGEHIGTIHHHPNNEKHAKFSVHGHTFSKMGDAAKFLHESHHAKKQQHYQQQDFAGRESEQHDVFAGEKKVDAIKQIHEKSGKVSWSVDGKKFESKEQAARYVKQSSESSSKPSESHENKEQESAKKESKKSSSSKRPNKK